MDGTSLQENATMVLYIFPNMLLTSVIVTIASQKIHNTVTENSSVQPYRCNDVN